MGLLAEYGSDSGSDNEDGPAQAIAPKPAVASTSTKPVVTSKKRAAPVKIGFDLLKPLPGDDEDESKPDAADSARKRPKLGDAGKGKGKSALLDMLPPPKRALPVPKPTASTSDTASKTAQSASSDALGSNDGDLGGPSSQPVTTASLLPRNLRAKGDKGKAAAPKEAEVDFFGISQCNRLSTRSNASDLTCLAIVGSATEPVAAAPRIVAPPKASISVTSAPEVADYVPPPPTANDPYPGYYQLPSGSWAAYDPEYYMSYFRDLAKEAEGPVGRGWEGVEKMDKDGMQDINVSKGLEEERRLAEERKKLTAPDLYSEESTYKVCFKTERFALPKRSTDTPHPHVGPQAVGRTTGKAGQRHQLTALLKDAHANRSALEERIAANKRTKRESGAKYGES
jgi:hypothetical protein